MYLAFHQLKLPPFENTPDPRFFFLSEDHREALANLVYAFRSHKGMVLITGEIGMGKTTTSYFLEARIGDAAKLVVIRRVPSTPKQLLWQVARQLGAQPRPADNRAHLFDTIEQQLHRHHQANKTVMIVIDEAQGLPLPVLDEVRLLSNLETATYKLCRVLLIGQSELREMLQQPRLEPLRQRIILAHHIPPLTRKNTQRYIAHRLGCACEGKTPTVTFTDEAIDRIHELAGGIIRQINVVADKCLLLASVKQTHEIDAGMVRDAAEHMVLGAETLGRIGAAGAQNQAA